LLAYFTGKILITRCDADSHTRNRVGKVGARHHLDRLTAGRIIPEAYLLFSNRYNNVTAPDPGIAVSLEATKWLTAIKAMR
jgi:hypothetical protein